MVDVLGGRRTSGSPAKRGGGQESLAVFAPARAIAAAVSVGPRLIYEGFLSLVVVFTVAGTGGALVSARPFRAIGERGKGHALIITGETPARKGFPQGRRRASEALRSVAFHVAAKLAGLEAYEAEHSRMTGASSQIDSRELMPEVYPERHPLSRDF